MTLFRVLPGHPLPQAKMGVRKALTSRAEATGSREPGDPVRQSFGHHSWDLEETRRK